jgi:pimeloyl-ACP methyl ester carboxylesterase
MSLDVLPLFLAALQELPELRALEPRTFRHDSGTIEGEAGFFAVPENRARKDARAIELAFVRLASTAKEPGPPVVYLAGGPGDSGTALAENEDWSYLLARGDVLLLDQRGTGNSRPALVYRIENLTPEGAFLDEAASLDTMVAVAEEAAEHWRAQGVDLTGYTTVESACDVDALCDALGYEQVVLMGHSYGTHLALEVVRRFPKRVEALVLAGVAGMDDMHKLPSELDAHWRKLARLVAADPALGKDIPDLFALLEKTLAALAEEPLAVNVIDPLTRAKVEVPFGPAGLRLLMLRDFSDTSDIPVLPRLVWEVSRRETKLLRWFVQKRYEQAYGTSLMALVMRGASGASSARWARLVAEAKTSPFGLARVIPPREVDRVLGTPDLGDAFRAPVKSPVRALFLSGTLDGNTPPEQAEAVRAGFPSSAHVIVENAGHEDVLPDLDVRAAIVRFLAGETKDLRLAHEPLLFVPLADADPSLHPSLSAR